MAFHCRLVTSYLAPKVAKQVLKTVRLACRSCNGFKAASIIGIYAITGESVGLFNPRSQNWADHFAWSEDGITIDTLTPVGRATIITLRMNHAAIVIARKRWVYSGWHPPD